MCTSCFCVYLHINLMLHILVELKIYLCNYSLRAVLHGASTRSNDESSGEFILPAADQRCHPASRRHQKHLQQPGGDRSAAL